MKLSGGATAGCGAVTGGVTVEFNEGRVVAGAAEGGVTEGVVTAGAEVASGTVGWTGASNLPIGSLVGIVDGTTGAVVGIGTTVLFNAGGAATAGAAGLVAKGGVAGVVGGCDGAAVCGAGGVVAAGVVFTCDTGWTGT